VHQIGRRLFCLETTEDLDRLHSPWWTPVQGNQLLQNGIRIQLRGQYTKSELDEQAKWVWRFAPDDVKREVQQQYRNEKRAYAQVKEYIARVAAFFSQSDPIYLKCVLLQDIPENTRNPSTALFPLSTAEEDFVLECLAAPRVHPVQLHSGCRPAISPLLGSQPARFVDGQVDSAETVAHEDSDMELQAITPVPLLGPRSSESDSSLTDELLEFIGSGMFDDK